MDLLAPLQLPERLVRQLAGAVDVWRDVAKIGRENLVLLDELERRVERIAKSLDELGETLESLRRLEAAATEGIALGRDALPAIERGVEVIELLIESVNAAVAKVDPLTSSVDRAVDAVGPLQDVVKETLPTLERAVILTQPLEGAVERLGRAVDRLPGGGAKKPARDETKAARKPRAAPKKK